MPNPLEFAARHKSATFNNLKDKGASTFLTIAAGGSIVIYDWLLNKRLARFTLHNLGTGSLKYAVNDVATDLLWDDILAGGVAALDGLGSSTTWDVKDLEIQKVTAYSNAGTTLVIIPIYDLSLPKPVV